MRISFVGKGGSGKSTLSASFTSLLENKTKKQIMLFDADLNIHAPELLGLGSIQYEKHLSNEFITGIIVSWLIGKNNIENIGSFRKTTPPTRLSNIININGLEKTPLLEFGLLRNNLAVFAVGTYQEDDIGASCYHNNLAVLESILNHTDDKDGYLISDMVAGVDSFAGTLHAQFDLTCLVVEPTKRSIEVFEKYYSLAKEGGVSDSVFAVGNKIRNEKDKEFIENNIPEEKILGYFEDDEHIREIDQNGESINFEKLNENNKELLELIKEKLDSLPDYRNIRLKKIWSLHKKYVSQGFIMQRFGDLTNQIDEEFHF
jgi:CO dehydrogenase maturation factor